MDKIFIVTPSLYFINNLQLFNKGIKITLHSRKVVTLLKFHESYENFTKLITLALERKHPIGLVVSKNNEVIAMQRADNDIVKNIFLRDEETFVIQFQGHDGFFYLERNHPDFDRIYAMLDKSKIDSQRVWFIAQLPQMKIFDVILEEEK
jgi:hypothetical protein